MEINERFTWAAGVIAPKPGSKLLEIGCGAGLLAGLIADKLTTGHITAIDKSQPMIRLATQRNQAYITAGKATFQVADFVKAALPENTFDKVVAFNVNFFWKKPEKELLLIKRSMKPNGQLFVFYQTPYGIDMKLCELIKQHLQEHAFQVKDTLLGRFTVSGAFCILANPVAAS